LVVEAATSQQVGGPYATRMMRRWKQGRARPGSSGSRAVPGQFNGGKGDRVPGYFYVPKRQQATILQSVAVRTGGNKKTDVHRCHRQAIRGARLRRSDNRFTGCGERKNTDKKSAGVLGKFSTEQVMHYCGDYSRAVDFLATRPEVDRQRLGYVGVSWGRSRG